MTLKISVDPFNCPSETRTVRHYNTLSRFKRNETRSSKDGVFNEKKMNFDKDKVDSVTQ